MGRPLQLSPFVACAGCRADCKCLYDLNTRLTQPCIDFPVRYSMQVRLSCSRMRKGSFACLWTQVMIRVPFTTLRGEQAYNTKLNGEWSWGRELSVLLVVYIPPDVHPILDLWSKYQWFLHPWEVGMLKLSGLTNNKGATQSAADRAKWSCDTSVGSTLSGWEIFLVSWTEYSLNLKLH